MKRQEDLQQLQLLEGKVWWAIIIMHYSLNAFYSICSCHSQFICQAWMCLKLWSFEHNKSGLPSAFSWYPHDFRRQNVSCVAPLMWHGVRGSWYETPILTFPQYPAFSVPDKCIRKEEWGRNEDMELFCQPWEQRSVWCRRDYRPGFVFSVGLLPLDRRGCNLVKSLFRWWELAGCAIDSGKGSKKGQYEKNLKGLNNEHPHQPLTETVSHIHQVWCGLVDRQTWFTFFHISELSFWWQRYYLSFFYSSPGPQPLCNTKIAVDLEHPSLLIQFLCYSRYLSLGRKWQG